MVEVEIAFKFDKQKINLEYGEGFELRAMKLVDTMNGHEISQIGNGHHNYLPITGKILLNG